MQNSHFPLGQGVRVLSLVLSVGLMSVSGGLLSERTPTTGMLLGAVSSSFESAAYDNMTVAELTAERTRLLDEMPSPGLGIGLLAGGAGLLLVGLIIATVSFEVVPILVGLVMMVASVPLLIIGPILMARAFRERRGAQNEVRLIDLRISQVERGGQSPVPTQPGQEEVPPPPPMRPPGAEFLPTVAPNILLATF